MINKPERSKLAKGLKKFGLVEPPVWNKRTGNIVGGHQRLSILDEQNGGQDYELEVSVVDLDPVKEKELNLLLNNEAAQGTWDDGLLAAVLKTEGLDYEAAGFDRVDLELILGEKGEGVFVPEEPASVQADAAVLEKIKAEKAKHKQEGKKADDATFVLHLVFGSGEEAKRFLRALELPEGDAYIDGRALAAAAGYDLDQLP